MRQHPVGTGPFKFVEFKPNEYVKLAKNTDYWKPGRPYLDGIEYDIFREIAPRNLAFFAGGYDVASPYGVSPPTLKDFKEQAPQAICEMSGVNVPRTMLINPTKPPFDNIELRRAMTLAIDRDAFSKIINGGGVTRVGALMMPPPEGVWGLDEQMLKTLPGYDPDFQKSLAAARDIMKELGYGPDKHLVTKLSTRDIPSWRQPAVLLNSQLKEIYIDADLDIVDTVRNGIPRSCARISPSARCRSRPGSTTRTRCSSRISAATRCGIMPAIATPISMRLVHQQSLEPIADKRRTLVAQIEEEET